MPAASRAPIEFACPHCRAVLRAPHDAAGGLGDCPHCDAECRVPGGPDADVADPLAFVPVGKALDAEAVGAAVAEVAPVPKGDAKPRSGVRRIVVPEPDDAVELEFEEAPETVGSEFPTAAAFDSPDGDDAPDRPARRSRRTRRGSRVVPALLLVGVLAGAGAAGWAMYGRIAGPPAVTLTATPLPADAAEPAELFAPADADPRAVAVVAAGVPMRSPLLTVTLSAAPVRDGEIAPDPRPIRVAVEPGEAGRLVRVDLADRPEVAAWREDRRDLVGAKRLAFVRARDRFFAAVAAGGDVGAYREPVALSAATDVLGWGVEAVAGARVAPCCRERADGSLLFALPADAATFTLRGRDVPGEGTVFPYRYEVTVRP